MIGAILTLILIAIFILAIVTIFTVRFAVTNQSVREAMDIALIPLYIAIGLVVVATVLSFVLTEQETPTVKESS